MIALLRDYLRSAAEELSLPPSVADGLEALVLAGSEMGGSLVFIVCDGKKLQPILVAKTHRFQNQQERLRREHNNLAWLTGLGSAFLEASLPRPIALADIGGRLFSFRSFLWGYPRMCRARFRDRAELGADLDNLRAVQEWFQRFQQAIRESGHISAGEAREKRLGDIASLETGVKVFEFSAAEKAYLEEVLRRGRELAEHLPVTPEHGDFVTQNVLFASHGGRVGILDWHRFSPVGWPLHDLLVFLHSYFEPFTFNRRWDETWWRLFLDENPFSQVVKRVVMEYAAATGLDASAAAALFGLWTIINMTDEYQYLFRRAGDSCLELIDRAPEDTRGYRELIKEQRGRHLFHMLATHYHKLVFGPKEKWCLKPTTLETEPLVSVVVLNYNGKHLLDDCLRSLLAQTYPNLEIILVDNGSSDGSAEYVACNYPQVKLVRSQVNLGYDGGNNLGVQHSRGELVAILNNDVVVDPQWAAELVKAVQADEAIAVATSKVTHLNAKPYQDHFGTVNVIGMHILQEDRYPTDMLVPNGAAFIFKKHLVGLPFDPDYFAYYDETYLGMKVRLQGYRVAYAPNSRLVHLGGIVAQSDAKLRPLLAFLLERNRLLNLFLFYQARNLLKVAPLLILHLLCSRQATRWRAYFWLLRHLPTVWRKRRAVQSMRRLGEDAFLRYMSGQLTYKLPPSHPLNRAWALYCRLVGLRTQEFYEKAVPKG